jgi:tRNA pseudouridine55 synthase
VRVDGILNIDKPAGLTSFAVVSLIRRLTGERRAGHTGTLDPEATGVLVVCLGQATRIVEFLSKAGKAYRAEIELGTVTDSYDATGRVVRQSDTSGVTADQVIRTLDRYRGVTEQIPPMHSALKHKGRRLYQLAREGKVVDREPRRIEVSRLDLVQWQPPVITIEVECGAGTYIRSLAHDLGQALGCGAHLRKLVRLRSEPFCIDDAISLDVLQDACRDGSLDNLLHSTDEVLLGWRAVILDRGNETLVRRGRDVVLDEAITSGAGGDWARAYTADGHFIAALKRTGERLWHPEKVFRDAGRESGQPDFCEDAD